MYVILTEEWNRLFFFASHILEYLFHCHCYGEEFLADQELKLPLSSGHSHGNLFPIIHKKGGSITTQAVPGLWGINGIASVAGSIISIVISMKYGFDVVLYTAILIYSGVSVLMYLYFYRPQIKS